MRDHSSMRRAPSIMSASTGIRTITSVGTLLSVSSANEKYPSFQLITSKTTSSIWKWIWRSTSRCVITPSLAVLHVARPLEVGLGDLAGAQQQRAERVRVAADLRRYDDAVVEIDLPLVVTQLRGDAQRPGLPAQIEQLEDVVDPELA